MRNHVSKIFAKEEFEFITLLEMQKIYFILLPVELWFPWKHDGNKELIV